MCLIFLNVSTKFFQTAELHTSTVLFSRMCWFAVNLHVMLRVAKAYTKRPPPVLEYLSPTGVSAPLGSRETRRRQKAGGEGVFLNWRRAVPEAVQVWERAGMSRKTAAAPYPPSRT